MKRFVLNDAYKLFGNILMPEEIGKLLYVCVIISTLQINLRHLMKGFNALVLHNVISKP